MKQRFLVLALGVSALAGCANDPSSNSADPDDAADTDTDTDTVDVATASLATDRGVSLAEATQRMAWQDKLDELEAAIQADSRLASSLAAIWIDTARGDRVQVAVTADANPADVMAIARRLGIEVGTDVVPAQRSRVRLEAIAAELGAQVGDGANVAIAIDPVANVVAITVPPEATDLRAFTDGAAQRYGAAVEVREAAAATPAATSFDPPMRGGVKMFHSTSSETTFCTTGFFARGTAVSHKPYIISAGHCVTDAGNSGAWSAKFANGSTHGLTNGGSYKVNAGGDMSVLAMINVSTWKPHPWVVVQTGPSTTYNPHYTIAGTAASHVGTRVCHTGITSGTHCGTIQKLDVPITYDGVTIVGHQVQSTMCGKSGDSGGPVFASHKALGTFSATGATSCVSYYEPIGQIESQLGVAVAHCVVAGGKTDDTGNCCSLRGVYNDTPPNDFTCR